ncbi:MAG: hypothetical protein RIR26_1983 [Pseudomonadota bacterium]|jgi:hypothetical protein
MMIRIKAIQQSKLSPLRLNTLVFLLGLTLSVGCETNVKTRPRPATGSNATVKAKESSVVGVVKTNVTPDVLDSAAMRLTYMGVTPYSNSRFKFPVVSFSMPEQADYVQILRCRADANLGELGNIEIGASNSKQADAMFQNVDFWQRISSNMFCAYITTGSSNDQIIDFYANSGDYVYVGRACVEKSRLNSTDPDVLANTCSRQVAKSKEYPRYVNLEKSMTIESKEKLRVQRDKVDALGRELVYMAKLADQQVSGCEKKTGTNKASIERRAALGKIIGTGIDLGAKLLGDGLGSQILGGLASDFGSIFSDLNADPNDFLPEGFCPEADLTLARMQNMKQQLKAESDDYNERVKSIGEAK